MKVFGGVCLFLLFVLHAPAKEGRADLLEVTNAIPGVKLDIRYATTNNFTHHILYSSPRCFLRAATVKKLAAVQKELEAQGLGLKIFDGYRPFRITEKMWDLIHDDRYVADPRKGSKHNRGAAVDLTVVDKTGKEIDMPTGYDDFTEKAHRDYMQLSKEKIKNRELLRRVMEKNGFEGVSTEWWHFNDKDWEQYDILNWEWAEKKDINRK